MPTPHDTELLTKAVTALAIPVQQRIKIDLDILAGAIEGHNWFVAALCCQDIEEKCVGTVIKLIARLCEDDLDNEAKGNQAIDDYIEMATTMAANIGGLDTRLINDVLEIIEAAAARPSPG